MILKGIYEAAVMNFDTLSCSDGICERVHPVGGPDLPASRPPVYLEHEDQHLH